MSYILWTCLSIVLYIVGVMALVMITPRLLFRSVDDGLFLAFASAEILGAISALGSIVLLLAVFEGNTAIRIVSFFLLFAMLIVSLRLAYSCWRPLSIRKTVQSTRIGLGIFSLALALITIYFVIRLVV